ncbi:SGNH/GDSL hydrolase family protein [Patescibacteria group bacterium]
MFFKKIKPFFYTALFAFIFGFIVSPFVYKPVSKAFLSPISPTLADTKNYIMPLTDGEVLGALSGVDTNEQQESENNNSKALEESGFSQVLSLNMDAIANIEDKIATPSQEKTDGKNESQNVSNYSGNLTIAIIGDSMVDVMGRDLPALKNALKIYFPKAYFNLLNYGVGAENIEMGLSRIKSSYNYKDISYQSLSAVNPDFVIIESFSYNPFASLDGELDKHWSFLSQMVDFVKTNTNARILMMATIAPAKIKFGQGPGGVNWPAGQAWEHATRINSLLVNTISFANSAGLPLINAYHLSLQTNGEGNPSYISSHDHIHQNEAGNVFISTLIAKKIYNLGTY